MTTDPSIDLIRARMARIRARAQGKADRIGEESRQFLDWKHYIRLFPWSTLAAAAVVGYILVPRRAPISRPAADALVQLARENQEVLKAVQQPPRKPEPGFIDTAVSLAGSALWRAGLAYATQQVGNLLTQSFAPPAEEQIQQPREMPRHDFV